MRTGLLLSVIGLNTSCVFANEEQPKTVVEKITYVVFAPEKFVGKYYFKVLSDGTVQFIDNKEKVTTFAHLSDETMSKLAHAIAEINDFTLENPGGPECMDAPSHTIVVHSNNSENTIWKNQNCKIFSAVDSKARQISEIINNLKKSYEGTNAL